MASVEKIQAETGEARKKFLEAKRRVDLRTHYVGAGVAQLRGLLAVLEGATEKGMCGNEQIEMALQANSLAETDANEGLGILRSVTSGATSGVATKMVSEAAKTHGEIVEGQGRLGLASEAYKDLEKPMSALKDALAGVLAKLEPELYNGVNTLELNRSFAETDEAILAYSENV